LDGQGEETCEWEQGDAALGNLPFVTLEPGGGEEAYDASFYEVPGFALITQTCDVLRRDEVQIAALIPVTTDELELTRRRRKPRFAYLPQLAPHKMVVDLDRVMTVQKVVLAGAERLDWALTDGERRLFADALARHKERFAFPNDFVDAMQPLRRRLDDKKNKDSAEGRLIRAASELRVAASPSWDGESVEVTLFCLLEQDSHSNDRAEWAKIIKTWEGLCKLPKRLVFGGAILSTYEEMSAADYLGSDKLDLDYMST
jgi:hypothetical protein